MDISSKKRKQNLGTESWTLFTREKSTVLNNFWVSHFSITGIQPVELIFFPASRSETCINGRISFAFFQNSEISLFEINIRFMGSLLACYALTGDVMFRDKAAQLGERMLPAFQTHTGIPHSVINLHTGVSPADFAVLPLPGRHRQRILMLIISDARSRREIHGERFRREARG